MSASVSRTRRWLLGAERVVDGSLRRVRGGSATPPVLFPHAGYQHPGGIECFGRVLERAPSWMPSANDGRLANLRGVGSLFVTNEVPGESVRIDAPEGDFHVVSDQEGYIRATIPTGSTSVDRTEWTALPTSMRGPDEGTATLPILRVGSDARFAVISDVDDTVMETGAENLARNLWTTFTGNPYTRRVYGRVPALYRGLATHADGVRNPLFYLSSSPWNLYEMLREVFAREDVPWGPIFLRDYGIDEDKFIKSTHGAHKLGHARTLMGQLDGLPFVLIGDLGQADAEIYATLARERPGQVAGVILHRPSERRHEPKLRHVGEIEALGVPVVVTDDYAAAVALAREKGWIDRIA